MTALRKIKAAREWYQVAADAGNGEAWSKLGFMTLQGQGAEPDPQKVFELTKKALLQAAPAR
ncbi:MAG: hypothetical protein R3D43_03820 [Tepidamorphaceae bacterium]